MNWFYEKMENFGKGVKKARDISRTVVETVDNISEVTDKTRDFLENNSEVVEVGKKAYDQFNEASEKYGKGRVIAGLAAGSVAVTSFGYLCYKGISKFFN